jgi:hypothetical protein
MDAPSETARQREPDIPPTKDVKQSSNQKRWGTMRRVSERGDRSARKIRPYVWYQTRTGDGDEASDDLATAWTKLDPAIERTSGA